MSSVFEGHLASMTYLWRPKESGSAIFVETSTGKRNEYFRGFMKIVRSALIAQLIKAQLQSRSSRSSRFDRGSNPTSGMSFFKLPFSPLLSYLGVCEDLNAQTCN